MIYMDNKVSSEILKTEHIA